MDTKEQLRYYESLLDAEPAKSRASRKDTWDHRASEWEEKYRKNAEREQHEARIRDTAAWLRDRGLLTEEQDAADIGCGPGRFVAEFARTARSAFGTDISPEMTAYGEAWCRELGLKNTSFQAVDFRNADIRALGWEKKFDLAFSSITPAVSGGKGLDNLIAVSRAWCFNASFVYSVNDLHSRIMRELFDREPRRNGTSHAHRFHELFNVLWLRGYYPECTYYKQKREVLLPADRGTAERLCYFLLEEGEVTEENTRRILQFLELNADANGLLQESSECWYGWLLWDVRDRHER